MNKGPVIFLVLIFGLPFLLITDLFPLHRYGMFAALPSHETKTVKTEIHVHSDRHWKKLVTGNEYLDAGYLPKEAELAFGKRNLEKTLGLKLVQALKNEPDSILIQRQKWNLKPEKRTIFP